MLLESIFVAFKTASLRRCIIYAKKRNESGVSVLVLFIFSWTVVSGRLIIGL